MASTSQTDDNIINNNNNNGTSGVSVSAALFQGILAMCWYVVPPVLLTLGSLGNVMTVVVMRGMPSSQSTACLYFYFSVLAVSDQFLLFVCLVFYWIDMGFSWPESFFRFDILCSVPKFIWNACGVVSAWVLIAMTYQRVMSVMTPHRVGVLCTVRRGKVIVVAIVLFACAMHAEYLVTWVYWAEYRKCQYARQYMHFTEVFEWMELVFTSILPFLFLVAGNSVLVWQVVRSSRLSKTLRGSLDQQTKTATGNVTSLTRTLIVTSVVFLILTLPVDIFDVCVQMTYLNIADEEVSAMLKLIRTIVTILCISGYATNFYLYVLSGRRFREETAKYLCCRNSGPAK
ncbi:hypothetical protein ACOMHN_030487 [Nucella lapillus]